MGTKGKLFALLLALLLIFAAGQLPQVVLNTVPTAQVILPQQVSHTPTVSCSGVLEAAELRTFYASQNLVVSRVLATEGDTVKAGDTLAFAEAATVPAGVAAAEEQEQLDAYYALAKKYGMEEQLEEYLSQQTAQAESPPLRPFAGAITAQQEGRLLSLHLKEGQLLPQGQPLYSVDSDGSCIACLEVEEADLCRIAVGNRVLLSGPGLGEKTYTAHVTHIAPAATRIFSGLESRTVVKVTALVDQKDPALRPGLSLKGEIAVGQADILTAVPYEAVAQDQNNREYVYQLENGAPVKRYIEVKNELADCVQVTNGLKKGAAVIYRAETFDPEKRVKFVFREEEQHD